MSSMVPAGGEGGGGNESHGGGGNTGTEQAPPNLQQPDSQQQQQQQQQQQPPPPQQQHSQHPPPSPLSGCYLLVVLPEPHSAQHKDLILNRLSKGFLSWDKDSCHVDLEKELQALVAQAPEGEEARNGERLIQYATENLVTEVLIYPQSNTLLQCIRNLLASFTKHRHIIHAGYTFGGNGSWILQDGTFSLSDFLDAFSEHEVQRVLRAYENSVTVDIHCASVGDWTTTRFSKEACTRACRVRVNPDDVLTAGVPAITNFTNYIGQYLIAQTLDQLMEPSDVVGNIRFSHPTLYVFPGGQGDAALFGINGFNMLVDGGFARKACFWDFARHLDRLDAVLVTRINNSNIGGMSSVLRKKKEMYVYPQIGHFFCNLVERRHSNSPDGDKDIDPLILDLIDIGQEMIVNLRHINLRPHPCYRDPEPINLYHKVGHGTLDMYVLSPSKDSREVREFLAKWSVSDSKLFAGSHKKDSNSIIFPIQNLVSICAMLVWQPANPEDTITRILFPGSTPQNKIFEGFERLKHLEFLKHPVCTAKSLSPSTSLATLKEKHSILKPKLSSIERETKRLVEGRREKRDSSEVKAVKKDPVIEESATKISTTKPILPTVPKTEIKAKKVVENKKLEPEVKESKKIEKELKESKVDVKKVERSEGSDVEMKKTDIVKAETEKTVPVRDPKMHKTEIKKKDIKDTSKLTTKLSKVDSGMKPSFKSTEKKSKVPGEKKDVIKSSPTTPKKSINSTTIKADIPKTGTKSVVKVTSKMTSSAPAKSTKDANNRMVVEQKNIELSSMATSSGSITGTKAPMKVKSIERKPLSRRTKPVSPSKARLPISPAKSARSTPSTSVKSDKDAVIRKVKGGTADSSAVSTPSGIETETAIKLIDKNLTEKSEDMSLDSIESKVLADLKEEREVVEEIEAVLQKAERIEARKEERFEGDDEITAEATDKKEEDVTEEDVTAEMDEIPKKISRKESQEFTEEDEYLIVEKEEIYTEDSVQSGDTERKHHLDEAESEKIKEDIKHKGYSQVEEKEFSDEKKDEMPEKKVDLYQEPKKTTELSPEHKELLKEEMKQIIASAKEVIKKTEEKDESAKRDSEDITKDPSSLSPDKLDFMLKPEVELKEIMIEKLDESQERISTLESGATTTAPTLPEDERIPLDEIKEDVDEKHAIEDVKEKCIITKQTEDIPETLPVISKAEVKVLDVGPLTQQGIIRDVVKTPDEVADLPVHEEVDPKLYRLDELDKEKDLKATLLQEQKESTIASTAIPVKETKDKGVFSFFGKVADKFEKGIDILTKKTRRDSEKDVEDKSSKSSSPKEPKPQEKISIGGTSFDKVFSKIEKNGEKAEFSYELKSREGSDKKSIPLDNSSFLESEKKESKNNVVETITSSESKITLPRKDAGEDIDDTDEVEAFVEEASKKFRNVKDSLQDSLESLDEKVDELSKLPFDSKDAVSDTLSGVAEKLKPDLSSLSESKEPEKVKFIIPSNEELEDDVNSGGVVRDFKEAVRDVAEVLVGTAGIEIEKEEKPKDVEEIVKKVAKVLKTDDFLTDQPLLTNVMAKNSSENLVIPKKVGITEELSVQEELEEFLEKELIDSSAKNYETDVFEIKKETCSNIDKKIIVKTQSDKEEAMRLCDDIMSAEHIINYDTDHDAKQDVMDLGLEEVCIKKTATREVLDEKLDEKIVVQPEISFDQNLSPGKVELVTVTPGSTPTSPKIPTEEQLADLPTEDIDIFNKNESLKSLIEEFIVSKKHKITIQILEYIATIKSVPKDKIISIIHEVIIKFNIPRENVADNIEVLRISDNISSEKRLEIENYVYNKYLNKNNKIILSTIEEISGKEMIPKRLVIEIIEEIIVKKHINRENVFDIDKDKYLTLYKEGLETPLDTDEDKALSSITVGTNDENIVDGFVSIPSTETVKALQSQDDSKILDDFEAVEQEYKVSGVSSISSSEKLISEKDKQEVADDVSDVIEADEKFVKETFEKDVKEDDSADKEQIKDEQKSVQNLEISEADTKEKYLDEDKEKTLAIAKTVIYETEEKITENKTTSHKHISKEIEQKDIGKEFYADVAGHSENINIQKSETKNRENDLTQSLLKLSVTETISTYDSKDTSAESVFSQSPIEKDNSTKKIIKSEDLKTEEQQSSKLDTLCAEIEVKESASTAKSIIDSETLKNTVEERSVSPSEEKLIVKEDITSEIIVDSEKFMLITDKTGDKSKSPSIEKEVHKINVSPDSKEIPKDSKTLTDKTKDKLKSPSTEKEDEKSEIFTVKPIILDDLKALSDTTEERSNIKEMMISLERETTKVVELELGKLEDKSISLSVEKETTKTEFSPTKLIESEVSKTVIKRSEGESKSPCLEKEIEKSDVLHEKILASKDAQLANSKLDDTSKSCSIEKESTKSYLLSESMIPLEIGSDSSTIMTDSLAIENSEDLLKTAKAKTEAETKLTEKYENLDDSKKMDYTEKMDIFSQKVKLPDEVITTAINMPADISKSSSLDKEEIKPKITSETSNLSDDLVIEIDKLKDKPMFQSIEEKAEMSTIAEKSIPIEKFITEIDRSDILYRSKSPSSEEETMEKTISHVKVISSDDTEAATDKLENRSRSPSAGKEEGEMEKLKEITSDTHNKSKPLIIEKEGIQTESSFEKVISSEDLKAAFDKSEDRSKSPEKVILPEDSKEVDSKLEYTSKSPSIEKEAPQISLEKATFVEDSEDMSRLSSAKIEEMKTKDSSEKVLISEVPVVVGDKSEDRSKSPSLEKDVGQKEMSPTSPSLMKDFKVTSDKSDEKSRSPSAEKDEGEKKDSTGKRILSEDSTDKSMLLEQSELVVSKSDSGSKSPSIEKEMTQTEISFTKEMSLEDAKVAATKSEDSQRSSSAEKDMLKSPSEDTKLETVEESTSYLISSKKFASIEKELSETEISLEKETLLEDMKAVSAKSEDSTRSPSAEKDKPKSPSEERNLETLEESAGYLTPTKKSPSIEKELTETEISIKKEILLEDMKAVSDKPDKSRSPSTEKDEEKKLEPKILSEDSKAVIEKLEDRSKSPSVEKELRSSENLTDNLLPSTILPEKTSDRSKSPSVEKEAVQTESSFVKPISSEDLKEAFNKSKDRAKSPEKVILSEDSKEVVSKLEDKSKSPSVEKEVVQMSLEKAKLEDASKSVLEQSKDISIAPSTEIEEKKTKESSEQEIISEVSVVVGDKSEDRSKSPSMEKDAGQTEMLPVEDRSKSPSLEKDAGQKEMSPSSPTLMKDSKDTSDKSDEKSRSSSAEKDEGEKKDSTAKGILSEDSTDKSMLLEQSESVVSKTDSGSKSPSIEKEMTQTEISFTKEMSLEDAKVAAAMSKSPSEDTKLETVEESTSYLISSKKSSSIEKELTETEISLEKEILLEDMKAVSAKSEDNTISPSAEKDRPKSPREERKLETLEESAGYLTPTKKCPRIEKEFSETEISIKKEILLEDMKAVSDKSDKSRSPSTEKDEEKRLEPKILSEDSKALIEKLEDRSKSPSVEKELRSSENLTDNLLPSTVLPEKTSDRSKSPSVEKESVQTESSFVKPISSEDLKEAFNKSQDRAKSPENVILSEDSKEVVSKLEDKSKSPSVEKEVVQMSLEKAKLEDASKSVSEQSKDISIAPNTEIEEKKTKESSEQEIISEVSVVVGDKSEDRSKSPSMEKDAGQMEMLPVEDRSKSPSLEKDPGQKEMSPASPKLMKDSKVTSGKSDEKSRSPSAEKDEGEKKDSTEKGILLEDSTDKSMLLEQSESVLGKTDGLKSPSIEKVITKTEISLTKEMLEDAKATSVSLKEKSRSPSAEKEEKTKDTHIEGKLLEESEAVVEKREDNPLTPSVERKIEPSVDSAVTSMLLEKAMAENAGDDSHSPSIEKEAAQTEISLTKEISLEGTKAVSDKSEKSRSPSAEKDLEKTKDSSVKKIISEKSKSIVEKSEDKSKMPSVEKKIDASDDSADKSSSPSIEKVVETGMALKKEISLDVMKTMSDKSDTSRSPSAEKDEEKLKDKHKKGILSEDSKAEVGVVEDRSKSPSEEKRFEVLEDSMLLDKSKAVVEKEGDDSISASIKKDMIDTEKSLKKEISLEDTKALSDKSDKSRSPSTEKDEEKLKDMHKEEKLSEDSKAVDGKLEDRLKSPSEERKFEASEDSADKSMLLDKSKVVVEKEGDDSTSESIKKDMIETEKSLNKEISLEDTKALSDKSDKTKSPIAEKDEEKLKDIHKQEKLSVDSKAVDGKLENRLKSPSEERKFEASEDSADKSILLEKSKAVVEKEGDDSTFASIKKDMIETEKSLKKDISLEDTKALSDKSDKSRSPSAEKDEEKLKDIHKEEKLSENSKAVDGKLEDRLKSPSEERKFEALEDSVHKSMLLEKSKAMVEKEGDDSTFASIKEDMIETEKSLKKDISLEDTKALSDKSDKSSSPSAEKDEEKLKDMHKEEKVSEDSKAVDEKLEDRLKSPSEERKFEASEDSADKSMLLEKSKAVVEKVGDGSDSPGMEKDVIETEKSLKKDISLEDTKALSDKSDKSSSPSAEKDEEKLKDMHKEEKVSEDSKAVDEKLEDRLKSPSEERKFEASEDSVDKSMLLEKSKAVVEKVGDGSDSPGMEKDVIETEKSLKKDISLEDTKALSDKSDKSRSPNTEKDEEKLKDTHKEQKLSEDSKAEEKKFEASEDSADKSMVLEKSKAVDVKLEDRLKSPSEERKFEASKDSADKSMLLEKSKAVIEKAGDGSDSPGIEKDAMETAKSLKKGISLEDTKAVYDKSDKSRASSAEKDEEKMEDSYIKMKISEQSETVVKTLEGSLQSVSADKRLEDADSKSYVISSDCIVDDKVKDRSRSHSVFETGDKSPLLRSRAASLYDDKLSDKLANLELTKDSFSNKDNTFEEKDELHLSEEVLDDLQKEIFKRHLENERHANMEIKKLIADYILNEFISKKKIISHQIIDGLATNYDVDRQVVIGIISEVISYLKIEKKTVFDLEDKFFDESTQKILEDVEKLTILINDQYIAKKKIINSSTVDEIVRTNSVSRHLVILVIENIITVRGLRKESIVSEDVFETEETLHEFEQGQEKTLSQQAVFTEEQSKISLDTVRSFKSSPELKSTPLYESERPEPHIDEEIIISENKRTEIEALMIDDYMDRGIKITESVLEQIVRRTSLPKYIIIEIIEEIIIKKGLTRDIIANLSIFHDDDYNDLQQKNALDSTPEAGHYNDNLEKSISYTDYESPFHKAFVGGMTEMRTTHITTLSGKSTPELGARDGIPDSSSEIVGTVVSAIRNVSEKVEKADDSRVDDHGQIDKSQCKIYEENEQLEKSFDEIHNEAHKKDKEALKKVAISSHLNDNLETTRQFMKQESLSVKISPDKVLDKVPKDSVDTLIKSAEASNEDEKLISLVSQSMVNEQLEQRSTLLIKDLIQDENISKKSISDVPLPKDISFGESTGKCTPEVSMSPLIRDGSMIQSHLSGRSTPDKRSDNRSRTATPEGFRSGDVIRTIITTTRTMSDDGEIITTTREVTEATNEKGETVVLTEKTDIKVDDKLPENFISQGKSFDIPSSEVTDKEADLTSPRSDLSSGHSRAATNVWESSEERQTYSDEEQSSPPFFPSTHPAEHTEDESVKVKGQSKTESISSTAMSSSFYGELPSEPSHLGSSLTTVSDTVSFTEQDEFSFKKFTVEKEYAGVFEGKGSKKYVDEADVDFEKTLTGLEGEKVDGKEGSSFSQELEKSSSSHPDEKKKDPLADWGSPLGLPSPKAPRKFNLRSPVQACSSADLSPDSLNFDVINDWGEPMRLPSPAPATNELSNKGSPGTPKKEKKQAKKVISENLKNKKRSDSPSKNEKKLKDSKNKVQPVYLDLAYVAHHGNSFYTALEFFKKVRARYYVFSGTEPSREVYDALLEAKKTWEDKELEVTMIPTYDTDTLGYWVADNEEALAAHHIDLSPSASRCTINLQDHETSCSAYRLEF